MLGRKLAHYEIVELLGEGGMGAVYKARDHHLDRFVALKLLHADKLTDDDRRRRFTFEAKAASALNHPNIVTIHDVAADNATDFIAMEYVKGQTLHSLINRRGLPLNDVLKYSIQITSALAAAHTAGIIHRDLKPANIMVSAEGIVKVLDFGLAKLADTAPLAESEPTQTLHQSVPATEDGHILGTVAYMAPEQVEAKKIDARTDVFSFGAVLYEMVTGRRAFERDSRIGTLSAILKDNPPPIPDAPAELERVILRCLRKDPDRRYQTMRDVKNALEEVKEDSESGRLVPPSPPAPKRPTRIWAAAAGILIVALAAWLWYRKSPEKPQELVMRQLTADSGLTTHPVLSKDGKFVAYASDRAAQKNLDIWIHPLTAGSQPIRLTTHDSDETTPDLSPDGGLVAYRSERDGGGIYLVPAFGGEERLLVRAGSYPRFSPDGKSVAYCVGCNSLAPSRIYTLPVSGGTPQELASDVPWAAFPVFSTDGNHVLFAGSSATNDMESQEWWVSPVAGGKSIKTGAIAHLAAQKINARYGGNAGGFFDYSEGRILVPSGGDVWELDLFAPSWKPSGPARRLTSGSSAATIRGAAASRLVFVNGQFSSHLWKLNLDANKGKVTGQAEALPNSGGAQAEASTSSDGHLLAYRQSDPSGYSLKVRDLDTGKERVILSTYMRPRISPDGKTIAYSNANNLYLIPSAGGESELLLRSPDNSGMQIYSWTPDGKKIVYWYGKPIRFALLDPVTRQSTDLISHPTRDIHNATLSPDQRWVTFATLLGRKSPLWIAPFRDGKVPAEKEWIQVSEDGDQRPWWSPDGNLLYTTNRRDGARCIWAWRLDPGTKRPLGDPFPVHHFHSARFRIDPRQGGFAFATANIPNGLIFNLTDQSGNVWIAEPKAQ